MHEEIFPDLTCAKVKNFLLITFIQNITMKKGRGLSAKLPQFGTVDFKSSLQPSLNYNWNQEMKISNQQILSR